MSEDNKKRLLEACLNLMENVSLESGICCCGESMENHSSLFNSGHTPVDSGCYAASTLIPQIKKEIGG